MEAVLEPGRGAKNKKGTVKRVSGLLLIPLFLLGIGGLLSLLMGQEIQLNNSRQENTIVHDELNNTNKAPGPVLNLTLEEAINRAVSQNRSIADAADYVRSTKLALRPAEADFELKIFPLAQYNISQSSQTAQDQQSNFQLGLQLQKKFLTGTVISVIPSIQKTPEGYNNEIPFFLTQPLLRGLSPEFNLSPIKEAEYTIRAARRSLYLTQVDTIISTVRNAYEVTRLREEKRLVEESADRLRAHAELVKVKEKIGLASPMDSFRAKIQLQQAEENLTLIMGNYNQVVDSLKILLHVPMEQELEVETRLGFNLIKSSDEEAVQAALQNRVELNQAADTIKDLRRRLRVAKHNIWPELNLVLSYSRFGSERYTQETWDLSQNSWRINLVSSSDLSRTAEKAAYEQKLIDSEKAVRDRDLKIDQITKEVKDLLHSLNWSEKRIEILKEMNRQAEGQLELAKIKFRHGLANNFDLMEAENTFRRSQVDLLSTAINYIIGTYSLRAALGTLLERPSVF
jgi:outer membrane protein